LSPFAKKQKATSLESDKFGLIISHISNIIIFLAFSMCRSVLSKAIGPCLFFKEHLILSRKIWRQLQKEEMEDKAKTKKATYG